MIKTFIGHARNVRGWSTSRKLVAFAVDDYGNVRIASGAARAALEHAGMKANNRFDAFDSLESREDLEVLCDALMSVKDAAGHHAVFTAYALPANIDFEGVAANGFTTYQYEPLNETFGKLSSLMPADYAGAWNLWKEAMANRLLVPEFHGREHVNVSWFNEQLRERNPFLLSALRNRSYAGMSVVAQKVPGPYAAFEYAHPQELTSHAAILTEGTALFQQVFGRRPVAFTPPNYSVHPAHYTTLQQAGIKTIDTSFFQKKNNDKRGFRFQLHYSGQPLGQGMQALIRNVVFEPTEGKGRNWVEHALQQIETSFRWRKPAIISSHRVNFCGLIDPTNRKTGIDALRELLKRIVQRWPDAEFVSVATLQKIMGL